MDFSLILLLLTVFTGVMWGLDRRFWKKAREEKAAALGREFDEANAEAAARGDVAVLQARSAVVGEALKEPWWIDYTAGLFPVICIVFLLRSFLFEPFRIPSGSMLPTLHIGDFILVNKFDYGVRLPVANLKIIPVGSPERGDVVVFKYPMDPKVDYIKRVVGVPGDTVTYVNKVLSVNGVEQRQTALGDWVDPDTLVTLTEREEQLGDVKHLMAVDDRAPAGVRGGPYDRGLEACRYFENGFECKVPADHYFMMGDNRDNSEDSRYWGVVPDNYLVGRAFFIWANFSEMSRIGSFK